MNIPNRFNAGRQEALKAHNLRGGGSNPSPATSLALLLSKNHDISAGKCEYQISQGFLTQQGLTMKFLVAFTGSLITCVLASVFHSPISFIDASMVTILWILYTKANEFD